MFNFQTGDQIRVASKTSSHDGQTGVIRRPTKNPNVFTVEFKDGTRVNLWRTSIRRLDGSKEAHFYLQTPAARLPGILTDARQTCQAFTNGQTVVHTTQLSFLSPELLYDGYKLFLHTADLDVVEFRIGQPAYGITALDRTDDLYNAVKDALF